MYDVTFVYVKLPQTGLRLDDDLQVHRGAVIIPSLENALMGILIYVCLKLWNGHPVYMIPWMGLFA